MVIKRNLVLFMFFAWVSAVNGFGPTDIETPEKVESYKAELKTQSIEQLNALCEAMCMFDRNKERSIKESNLIRQANALATWKKWLLMEELALRRNPKSVEELEHIDKLLSKEEYNAECLELRAKVAVAKIRFTSRSETERVDALGKMLDLDKKANFFLIKEAEEELIDIGSKLAREVFLSREANNRHMKEVRLQIDIKNLPTQDAIDILLASAFKVLSTSEKDDPLMLKPEKKWLGVLCYRDSRVFLAHILSLQAQLRDQNENQQQKIIRYKGFLEDLRILAKKEVAAKEESGLKQKMVDLSNSAPKKVTIGNSPPVSTNAAPVKTGQPPSPARMEQESFTRPEDRGEDFSQKGSAALIAILSTSKDKSALKKAAKALGDMSAAGTLKLTEREKSSLTNIVQKCLQQVTSSDSNERSDGREQIERLWQTAVPGLLTNLANENPAIREVALKSLSLMKSEEIIRSLMDIAKQSPHEPTRMMAIFALGNMTEKRGSLIPGRLCMDEATSRELAEKQIRPFLNTLLATEKNAEMKALLERALKTLDEAPDRRPVRVTKK